MKRIAVLVAMDIDVTDDEYLELLSDPDDESMGLETVSIKTFIEDQIDESAHDGNYVVIAADKTDTVSASIVTQHIVTLPENYEKASREMSALMDLLAMDETTLAEAIETVTNCKVTSQSVDVIPSVQMNSQERCMQVDEDLLRYAIG